MARRNQGPIGSTVNYAPQTSEKGFYSPDPDWRFGGTNRDGSEWNTTWMKWNKAPTPQAAPAPAPTPAPKAAPKPAPKKPIVHSPEIKQAKERVQTYENDILSGKTSEDIYGSDKYSFDATKGAAGIGTPMNGSSLEQADKATASFLDNKKAEVKDKYQFQAQG